jgi:hypothetical protein
MNARTSIVKLASAAILSLVLPAGAVNCGGHFEFTVTSLQDGRPSCKSEYTHEGLTFIEGRQGEPFLIHFKNNLPSRVLVVMSVDGLDVIQGKPATAASAGYVVEPNKDLDIKGWRASEAKVRQFFFETKERSYAAETGHDQNNCGVIGCKVIAEQAIPVTAAAPPVYRYTQPGAPSVPTGATEELRVAQAKSLDATSRVLSASGSQSSPPAAAPEFKLGTGWGAPVKDRSVEVAFRRGREIGSAMLYYSDAASLERIGIVLAPQPPAGSLPRAFAEFCPPPSPIR